MQKCFCGWYICCNATKEHHRGLNSGLFPLVETLFRRYFNWFLATVKWFCIGSFTYYFFLTLWAPCPNFTGASNYIKWYSYISMFNLASNFLKIFESLQQEKAHENLKIFVNALSQHLYSATKNHQKHEGKQLKFSYSWV